MILRVMYTVDDIEGIVHIKNKRIITRKDVIKIEKIIEKKIEKKGVKIKSWKVIGSINEKIIPVRGEK